MGRGSPAAPLNSTWITSEPTSKLPQSPAWAEVLPAAAEMLCRASQAKSVISGIDVSAQFIEILLFGARSWRSHCYWQRRYATPASHGKQASTRHWWAHTEVVRYYPGRPTFAHASPRRCRALWEFGS